MQPPFTVRSSLDGPRKYHLNTKEGLKVLFPVNVRGRLLSVSKYCLPFPHVTYWLASIMFITSKIFTEILDHSCAFAQ